jgi:eukaryotic-like serine/threonine-protein kinase
MSRHVGPVIAGYTQVGYLGSGGFADVYHYQAETGAAYAVKVLRGALTFEARNQLRTEARALGRLAAFGSHPNIVTPAPTVLAHGQPYLIMELCPGGSLAGRGPMTVADVLRIGIQMCGALQTAHLHEVLHRDVKPGNILLQRDGTAKLSDFGIADLTASRLGSETTMLTLYYSAPEIDERGAASTSSDVYALAATLYELLAGRPPFRVEGADNSDAAIEARKVRNEILPIGRDDVPPRLERVLRYAMRFDVDHRQAAVASAEALGRELIEIAAQRNDRPTEMVIYTPTVLPGTPVRTVAATPKPPVGRWSPAPVLPETEIKGGIGGPKDDPIAVAPRRSRMRIGLGVAAAVVLVGAAVAVAIGVGTGSDATPGSTSPPPVVSSTDDVVPDTPPSAPKIAGRRSGGTVTFTWTYTPVESGDTFEVVRTDTTVEPRTEVASPTWTVHVASSTSVCIEVQVIRAKDGLASAPGRLCA